MIFSMLNTFVNHKVKFFISAYTTQKFKPDSHHIRILIKLVNHCMHINTSASTKLYRYKTCANIKV